MVFRSFYYRAETGRHGRREEPGRSRLCAVTLFSFMIYHYLDRVLRIWYDYLTRVIEM